MYYFTLLNCQNKIFGESQLRKYELARLPNERINVLFNDALDTFTVIWRRTYVKGHIERGNPLPDSFQLAARVRLYAPSHRQNNTYHGLCYSSRGRARCSSVVRAFAHGAMGRRIDPSWGGPIELFLVPASAPRYPSTVAGCQI